MRPEEPNRKLEVSATEGQIGCGESKGHHFHNISVIPGHMGSQVTTMVTVEDMDINSDDLAYT